MKVTRSQSELNQALGAPDTPRIFVPTMGALHDGHLSLVRHALSFAGDCVVSIFLNPTQFAPHEDLENYPRTLDRDLELLEAAGADAVYVPPTDEIYPDGLDGARTLAEQISLPDVAIRPRLEEATRPHFFGGVCLVVGRLFDLIKPSISIFGEKDYQQLLVIREMVALEPERFGSIEVIGMPTVREPDGLAMSSRNAYLNETTRPRARGLYKALEEAQKAESIRGATIAMRSILIEHELEVEYADVRNASNLDPLPKNAELTDQPLRALIAARLDGIRLIDNCAMPTSEHTDPLS